ncbi:hypothetical protein Cgig2_033173 [Carnegiea gigantea]|uniref:Transcription repressor n=1 Tax=Carnegiea gigantea TaxID=171969 RepID=A0A9Q1JNB6_9CARY|nr:hypothetical protein Cgig2_033173 [Carnegiea gigantea]
MSKLTLAKNFHLCFSMLKHPKPQLTTATTTTHRSPPPSATTTTFTKSYNSLYEDTLPATSSDTEMPDAEAPATPDLSAAYASRRFFFSSPGRSNSIVDSLSLSSLEEEPPTDEEEVVAGGVAVQTYSPDPYMDFRRSMMEMVAARELTGAEEPWEYLQELLLSYLAG